MKLIEPAMEYDEQIPAYTNLKSLSLAAKDGLSVIGFICLDKLPFIKKGRAAIQYQQQKPGGKSSLALTVLRTLMKQQRLYSLFKSSFQRRDA